MESTGVQERMLNTSEHIPSWQIHPSTSINNAGLLDLSTVCPMQGAISLYIDRSPNFFKLYELFDPGGEVWIAERGGNLDGCLGVIHDSVVLGGERLKAAYFRDFKISPQLRGGTLAVRLVRAAIQCEEARGTNCALVSILDGNEKSLVFTSGRAGIPRAISLGRVRYYSIPPLWRRRIPRGIAVKPWDDSLWPEVRSFLPRAWARYAFAPADPCVLFQTIKSLPGLLPSDILTAWRGDRLCGILASWDHESSMRYVVTNLTKRLRVLCNAARLFGRILPITASPRMGHPLRYRFVLLALVENEDEDIMRAMLARLHNDMIGGPWSHFSLCLHERDGLNRALNGLAISSVASNVFLFPNREDNTRWSSLSGKLIYPGAATYL